MRRGDHDSSLLALFLVVASHSRHEEMISRGAHESDSVSHASSDGGTDFLGDMSQMHSAHVLLPQLGGMPVFGSPVPPGSCEKPEPPRKRKSIVDMSGVAMSGSDWGQDNDEDSMGEDAFVSARPHIAWTVNNHETWHRIFDPQMNEMFVEFWLFLTRSEQPGFRVEVDKGFKHSTEGEGWICQKKNHFQVCSPSLCCVILLHTHLLVFVVSCFSCSRQVTIAMKINAQPAYVATRNGLLKVSGLFINIHGVKLPLGSDTNGGKVPLEQSQSDRSKKSFAPLPVAVLSNEITKVSVGRLHFTETTANNMRKKGKPNPDQRFFGLVVTLAARAGVRSSPPLFPASLPRLSSPALFPASLSCTPPLMPFFVLTGRTRCSRLPRTCPRRSLCAPPIRASLNPKATWYVSCRHILPHDPTLPRLLCPCNLLPLTSALGAWRVAQLHLPQRAGGHQCRLPRGRSLHPRQHSPLGRCAAAVRHAP